MDVSSGAAVSALLLNDHDRQESNDDQIQKQNQQKTLQSPFRVLDLCCAPGKHFVMSIDFYFCHASTILLILYIFLGLKTCTIVDLLSNNKNIIKEKLTQLREVHVIGVDISEQRLQLSSGIRAARRCRSMMRCSSRTRCSTSSCGTSRAPGTWRKGTRAPLASPVLCLLRPVLVRPTP